MEGSHNYCPATTIDTCVCNYNPPPTTCSDFSDPCYGASTCCGYCGDGWCESSESCGSCSGDCGSCYVAPTATLTATAWVYSNNPGPSVVLYAAAPFQISWSSANTTSCTLDGSSVSTSGSNSSYAASGSGYSHTFTLVCSNAGGSVTKQLTVSIPPDPTNLTASPAGCGAAGNTLTLSWTLPGGYSYSYVRVQDVTDANSANWFYTPMYQDDYKGSSITGTTVPAHKYSYWVHTDDVNHTGHPWSYAPTGSITCNNPGPGADIKANGSDGPITIAYNTAATLSWTSNAYTTSCNVTSNPAGFNSSGISNGGISTGNLTSTMTTYTLSCTGPGGSKTDAVQVAICPTAGNNVSLSPSTISVGNTSTASAPAGFTGGVFVSSNTLISTISGSTVNGVAAGSANISGTGWKYTSNGANGCTLGAAALTVKNGSPGGGSGSNITVTPQCSGSNPQNLVSWTAGTGATNYNIYRNTSNTVPGAPAYANVSGTSYTDTTNVIAGTQYYYWVESVGGDGTKVAASSNPVTANTCITIPGSGSASLSGDNSVCDKMSLSWFDFTGAITGYKLYRNTSNSIPGAPIATPAASPYPDSGLGSGVYYYWVKAVNGSGDSSAVAMTGNPKGTTACQASLAAEKDIVGLNHTLFDNSAPTGYLNGHTDALSTNVLSSLKTGDILSFSINLRNQGSLAAANISVVDNFINLKEPTSGFNAKYNGSALTYDGVKAIGYNPASGHYAVTGTAPNQTLVFNLTGAAYNIPAPVAPATETVRSLTFDAQLTVPNGYGGSSPRFQNNFTAYYDKTSGNQVPIGGSTPLILFTNGTKGPTIIEVP